MKKTIKEDKKAGTVTLTVEIPKRSSANDSVVNFLTRDAREILQNEGYTLAACRKNDSASNHREGDSHTGQWVFDVKSSRKTENKKENLTKKVEPAIIDREKGQSSQHPRKGK
tara:strand:- start:304 stop:642 length:339 start_codon:yes stop_codon:yes gene_type:complete